MGKRMLSLRKHPQDEQIQAISAAPQQTGGLRGQEKRGEERKGKGLFNS